MDYGRSATVLIILALISNAYISYCDLQIGKAANKIEEKYAKYLDENIQASRAVEMLLGEILKIIDAHLSRVDARLNDDNEEYENETEKFNEQITVFSSESKKIIAKYNVGLSNATNLNGEIGDLRAQGDIYINRRILCNFLTFIFLFLAFVFSGLELRKKKTEIQAPLAAPPQASYPSIADELSKLAALKNNGLISDDEYAQLKSKIINDRM